MIATTYDKQHGKAGTARGHCAFVGIEVSRLSPVAYDEQQVCRAVSPLCDMYLPVRTGGASRPVLFIRIAGGLCMGITRRADALAPSRLRRPALIAVHSGWHRQAIARTRWPAVQFGGISARTLSFNTGHHVPAKFADGPHVECLSSAFVASTDSDGARQWACQNQTMRMFA